MFFFARYFRNALQPLVHCALTLNPPERAMWLHELRIECPKVAQELERLLGMSVEVERGAPDAANPRSYDVVRGSPEHLGLRS
jgi:hypothetical protein